MSLGKPLTAAKDWFISSFNGPSPFVPQVLIGLGSVSFMPAIIATNKNEKVENRLNAAARTFVQEGIALPIALTTAALCGVAGSKLAKNPLAKAALSGATTTAGFVLANIIIPPLSTKILHALPIKEKIMAMAVKKGPKNEKPAFGSLNTPARLDITSPAPVFTNKAVPLKVEKGTTAPVINPYINTLNVSSNLKI